MKVELSLIGTQTEKFGPVEGKIISVGKRPENTIVISGNVEISGVQFTLEQAPGKNNCTFKNLSGVPIQIDENVSVSPGESYKITSKSPKIKFRQTEILLEIAY